MARICRLVSASCATAAVAKPSNNMAVRVQRERGDVFMAKSFGVKFAHCQPHFNLIFLTKQPQRKTGMETSMEKLPLMFDTPPRTGFNLHSLCRIGNSDRITGNYFRYYQSMRPFLFLAIIVAFIPLLMAQPKEVLPFPSEKMLEQVARLKTKGIPLTDYHIHIRGGMTPEKAFHWSKLSGIRSGVLENHGSGWTLSDNVQLNAFIEDVQKYPELLIGIQVNDRDWFKTIDPELLKKLDYILADTMIMEGQKLWFEQEYEIADENSWLERYFNHCMTVVNEPVTILANPTYLPDKIKHRCDDFWTEERMGMLIDAAVKNNVALEIQAGTNFPNKKFVELALKKGAKISIGRNNHDDKQNELKRSLDWLEELGVKAENMLDVKKRSTL
jgi:histidinol phosphatase-like PHP family hydrolase